MADPPTSAALSQPPRMPGVQADPGMPVKDHGSFVYHPPNESDIQGMYSIEFSLKERERFEIKEKKKLHYINPKGKFLLSPQEQYQGT